MNILEEANNEAMPASIAQTVEMRNAVGWWA